MYSRIIAAAIAVVGTIGIAATNAETTVELSFEITATSFDVRNISDTDQVVLFRNEGQELIIARTIPAGANFLYEFPRQAMAGVEVEVVGSRDGALNNSGVIQLDDAFAAGADSIWIQRSKDDTFVWFERDDVLETYTPTDTMLPEALTDAGGAMLVDYGALDGNSTNSSNSTHVPVITPSDSPEDYGPPELEEEPLPPV